MSKRRINELQNNQTQTNDTEQIIKKRQNSNELQKILYSQDFQDDEKFNSRSTNLNQESEELIKRLSQSYVPPMCLKCKNRRIDRVCVNKECGKKDFFALICGQCHNSIHQKLSSKSELIIEEFFQKLSVLIKNKETDKINMNQIFLDMIRLKTAESEIALIREKLYGLKTKIQYLNLNYLPIKESITEVEDSTQNFLKSDSLSNQQEQLNIIKQRINFSKNEFCWKDVDFLYKEFNTTLNDVENKTDSLLKNISNSLSLNKIIDLKQLKFQKSISFNNETLPFKIEYKNNEIQIANTSGQESQEYINFQLLPTKKYVLRFRFDNKDIQQHAIIGIMPQSKVDTNWVFGIKDQYFCKRFYACDPSMECSRIIRGNELSTSFQYGTQIEIRIDFENNYMDFTDYPNHNSINANNTQSYFSDEPYVFAISFYQFQQIVIEQFEEVLYHEEI